MAYSRERKLQAIQSWVDAIQERLKPVVDALSDADALARWEAPGQNHALGIVVQEAEELARQLEKLQFLHASFLISTEGQYERALAVLREKAEVHAHNGIRIGVPIWAVEDAQRALKDAGIAFTMTRVN